MYGGSRKEWVNNSYIFRTFLIFELYKVHQRPINSMLDIYGTYSGTSYVYLKYGTAHFIIFMFGLSYFAMASRTNIFVSNVANYPYSFMLFSLIIFNIPISNSTPWRSSTDRPSSTLKSWRSYLKYYSNFPFIIFSPSNSEML